MRRFEWDPEKEAANRRRHGVGFAEARSVLKSAISRARPDESHSIGEERFLTIGWSALDRVLAVTTAEDPRTIRIISARRATKRERHDYEIG